jgi:hypothetical protein
VIAAPQPAPPAPAERAAESVATPAPAPPPVESVAEPRAEPVVETPAPAAKTQTVETRPPFQEEPAALAHERVESASPPEVVARTALPGVIVERTLWHPDAGRRLAVLQVEGRDGTVELREGDAVGDLVVQQIDPSGVLFLHRGVEIRQRVGARD